MPVVLCPGQGGLLHVLNEQPDSKKPRRIYLSAQQGEDMWWAAECVNFVIDTGVQKKMASYYFYYDIQYLPKQVFC